MQREPRRWRTAFGRWVSRVGVRRLALDLQARGQPVTEQAIYHWLAGRRLPNPQRAVAIVRMSRGAIELDDVYAQSVRLGEKKPYL